MSLSLYGVPDGQKKGQSAWPSPIRILTDDGAQVALQRCLILRAGIQNFNTVQLCGRNSVSISYSVWSGFLVEATNLISSGFLREATGVLLRLRFNCLQIHCGVGECISLFALKEVGRRRLTSRQYVSQITIYEEFNLAVLFPKN